MAVTQKVTLYNNKFTVPPVINAVQNDTDRQVEAYFGDFTLQVGMTGKLSFIRSDGTHYEVSATLSTANNTATAELDQALTQAGVTQAQLKITDSGNVGSTFTFMIKVQPDVAGISQQQDGYSVEEIVQRLSDAEDAIEDVEDDVADLQGKEYDYAPVITDTASGAIANFTDGADGYPMRSVVAEINPVQDLHGYDNPWPAGGGKNKAKPFTYTGTYADVVFTVDSAGVVNLNGTASGSGNQNSPDFTLSAGTYYFSDNVIGTFPSNTSARVQLIKKSDSSALASTLNNSPADEEVEFTLSADTEVYYRIRVNSGSQYNNCKIRVMIRPTGTTSGFAPYSNICPITGFSEAKVTRTGKNLFNKNTAVVGRISVDGSVDTSTTQRRVSDYIKVTAGEQYYVSNLIPSNDGRSAAAYDENHNLVAIISISGASTLTSGVITMPANTVWLRISMMATDIDTAEIHKGTTAIPYEPFGTTHAIPLGRTVYGGTLDAVRGKLTDGKGRYVITGNESWTAWGSAYYCAVLNPYGVNDGSTVNCISSMLQSKSTGDLYSGQVGVGVRNNSVYIDSGSYADRANLVGMEIVYDLATPVEYDLTAEEIKSLLGENNVWTDTNGNITVAYCADTKLYIDKKLSEL